MKSLKDKTVMMENFDGFLNSILELRRFEKNFIYYRDITSIRSWNKYLSKVEFSIKELDPNIEIVAGKKQYEQFKIDFNEYRIAMIAEFGTISVNTNQDQLNEIRKKGKIVIDFAQKLIRDKQKHINSLLDRISIMPFTYFIVVIFLTVIVFIVVNATLIVPLDLIRSATEHVARDTFKPIKFNSKYENEITKLIRSFNRMALQLEERQRQLLQAKKLASIGTFTSGIAHELNNPLNNILLTAETLILDDFKDRPDKHQVLIEDIMSEADRASKIVRNLLEFSRNKQDEVKELDITILIENSLKMVKNQVRFKNITIGKNFPDYLPKIKGALGQLENAIVNIMINSIHAVGENGHIQINLFKADDEFICIEVKDNGKGIDKSKIDHIFDPFYTTKEVGKGTGLGLSLVYGIVQSHGGKIDVKSKAGSWTSFFIYLPFLKESI